MADLRSTEAPKETLGGSPADIRATTGDIRLVMQTIGELGVKIDRLITDRKDDKEEIVQKIDETKKDLKSRVDEKTIQIDAKVVEIKGEFKEFRKEEFKSLQDEVMKLRLKWAYVAGISAVVGILMSIAVEWAKSHLH